MAFASIAACPTCHAPLTAASSDELVCHICGRHYRRENGIWRFLTLEQQLHYAPFLGAYGVLRYCEGWERPDNSYYLNLPNVPKHDPQAAIWQIRRQTFKALMRHLSPGKQRLALDLGAGNTWLSHHLTTAGYQVLALDIRAAGRDGLECGSLYDGINGIPFVRGQAGANELPVGDGQIDLCVMSAVFHYLDPVQTLQNVFRILSPGGQLIVMDSPVYHQGDSGQKMVDDQKLFFMKQYGVKGAPIEGKGYLILQETLATFQETGFQTEVQWTERPGKWLNRLLIRPKTTAVHRELARFPLLIGTKPENLKGNNHDS